MLRACVETQLGYSPSHVPTVCLWCCTVCLLYLGYSYNGTNPNWGHVWTVSLTIKNAILNKPTPLKRSVLGGGIIIWSYIISSHHWGMPEIFAVKTWGFKLWKDFLLPSEKCRSRSRSSSTKSPTPPPAWLPVLTKLYSRWVQLRARLQIPINSRSPGGRLLAPSKHIKDDKESENV